MTTKQLYSDIKTMGFDRQSENTDADKELLFVSAVNRAQETLSAHFPLYEQLTINTDGCEARMKVKMQVVNPNETARKTTGIARSYIFTLRGCGEALIEQGKVPFARYTVNSPHASRTFIGEFPEASLLRITLKAGDSPLELTDMKVFTEAGAAREKCADFYVYRLDHLLEGALSLDAPPTNEQGLPLKEGEDYRTENGLFYLSDKVEGQVKLTVKRAPKRFDMDKEFPDVRPECAYLLPLLTASYVWLDDDREKALFYLAMYRESLANTRKNGRCAGVGFTYRTSNGW